MKNKKGFTLIELLAVIVILAIIALIAVPVILNMIENARKSAAKSSAYGYIDAINSNNELASMKNEDMGNIPDTISDGTKDVSEIDIKIKGKKPTSGEVTITNGRVVSADLCINNYMVNYSNNEAEVGEKCGGSTPTVQPVSFANDDWSVIAANTNSNVYEVGQKKEIKLDINNDGIDETYHLVIVNKSTPSECSTAGFSQSACGLVLQFEELLKITNSSNQQMNATSSSAGGWPGSAMNLYLNNTIYPKITEKIGDIIINTKTVSSHEPGVSDNYVSANDKLYLLSTKEVAFDLSNDSANDTTRTLDFYLTNSRKKYNYGTSTAKIWWLRSAQSNNAGAFNCVLDTGAYGTCLAHGTQGVAPAFRIG